MDFDQKDRNKNWNTEILDILPYGKKTKNAWPWCEATFCELMESFVWVFSICADTPAMFDIMCHKNNKSEFGCNYCWRQGKKIAGDKKRISWLSDVPAFARKTHIDYQFYGNAAAIRGEAVQGFAKKSPLLLLDRYVINRCNADTAHSLGYGVVLRFMLKLFKGQRKISITPFKPCKNVPRTAGEIKKEEERKQKYAIEKEVKLEYRRKQKLFQIDSKYWKAMDESFLRFCSLSGYSTTAVPMGSKDSTGSRLTMHECLKYAVNCYKDAKEIGNSYTANTIPPPRGVYTGYIPGIYPVYTLYISLCHICT